MNHSSWFGLRQDVEQKSHNDQEVVGSIPLSASFKGHVLYLTWKECSLLPKHYKLSKTGLTPASTVRIPIFNSDIVSRDTPP